jgi:hypothetical protein
MLMKKEFCIKLWDKYRLGEKFRSDDTIHTIIKNISDKTKSCAKLYSFHDPTIHVRGGIYRALVFVFYIKWLFYPWLKTFITLHLCKGKVVISSWFSLLFHVQSSFLQWTCSFQIIYCSLSTSLSSEVDFLPTKSISEVDFLTTKSIGEVEFLTTKSIGEVEFLPTKSINEVDFLTTKSIGEVEFLPTKSISEVIFLPTKPKFCLRLWCSFLFLFFWRSWILSDEVEIHHSLYFFLQVNFIRIPLYFSHSKVWAWVFLDGVNSPNSSPSRMKAYQKVLKFVNFEFLKRSHKKHRPELWSWPFYDRYVMKSVF